MLFSITSVGPTNIRRFGKIKKNNTLNLLRKKRIQVIKKNSRKKRKGANQIREQVLEKLKKENIIKTTTERGRKRKITEKRVR